MARARSKKAPRPKVRPAAGEPRPQHPPGMLPAKSFKGRLEFERLGGDDYIQLAIKLQADLGGYIRHGRKLAGAQDRLEPVLKAYAEALEGQRELNLFHALAKLAADVATGAIAPKGALATAKKLRGEKSWKLPDEGPVSVDAIEGAAKRGTRGPQSALPRAEQVYKVLAWDSRASEQPKDVSRDNELRRALKFWIEVRP